MGENSYSSVAWRVDTTNQDNTYGTLVEKLIQLEVNDWPKFQEPLKKPHSAEFYLASSQQQIGNGERSNVVVRIKMHVGSTTPTRTTSKSAKSPTKQLLHKSTICPPKSIKDRLKILFPIKPEQIKQKSQAPISQTAKIQMNTKRNNEKPGSAFKMPSRIKSPIRSKQCNAQRLTKSLQRTYSIESMDSDTDHIFANLNLEEVLNNFNT